MGPRQVAQGGRSLGGFQRGEGACFHLLCAGSGDVLEGKAGELLRCFWPGSLPGDSSIPSAGHCLQPGWAFPRFRSLHCPVVFNGSKAASGFLAITIPFFLPSAFHHEISEAFNW